jgi:cell filamentation protein
MDKHQGSISASNASRSDEPLSPEQVASISAVRLEQQQREPISGQFNAAHLQAIHRATFRDIAVDAGQLRVTGLSSQQADGNLLYLESNAIRSSLNGVAANIEQNNRFKDLPKEEFAKAIASTYSQLNAIHPFRDGNERVAREFVRQLSKEAGYDLDYTKVNPAQWREAAKHSFDGQQGPITTVFASISEPVKTLNVERGQPAQQLALDTPISATSSRLSVPNLSQQSPDSNSNSIRQDAPPRDIDTVARSIGVALREPRDLTSPVKGSVIAETKDHYLVEIGAGVGIAVQKQQDPMTSFSRMDIAVLAPRNDGSLSIERAATEKEANIKVTAYQNRSLEMGERV